MGEGRAMSAATRNTVLLSLGLLGAAAIVVAVALGDSMPWLRHPVTALLVAVAFFVAEQYFITFEFRRESHSMTFAGVPLAFGIMALPVPTVVLARLVGSLTAMLVQRTSPTKVLYNCSAYCFEAAASGLLGHLVLGGHRLDAPRVIAFVCVVAAVDQLMTALVLLVIRFHGARASAAETLQVQLQSLVLSVIATAVAVVLRILTMAGVTGCGLAVVLIVVAVFAYRAYAATAARHESLTMVHDFVTDGAAAITVEDLLRDSLSRVRAVLRASSVELALIHRGNSERPAMVYRVDLEDRFSSSEFIPDAADWVRHRALHSGLPTLAVRSDKDAATIAWLDEHHMQDAIVVPLTMREGDLAVLTACDRLTDVATFTADDLHLLQTLAGHLAVALHNARLVDDLSYEAMHDALTGLGNRTLLSRHIAEISEVTAPSAVMLFDLDKFKEVNDVLGHEAGDRLLRVVAERLRECLPDDAVVTRLGGDEFAVLVSGLSGDVEHSAVALANRASSALLQPVEFDDVRLTPKASIGIAVTTSVGPRSLLRCADTAMYAAKTSGADVAVYDPAMDSGRAERLALLADMRIALEQDPSQFTVHFQPKVDLDTGAVVSAEALVRWLHPVHGVLSPLAFINIAETSGLIGALTAHVIDAALRECASWQADGHYLSVAVNVPAGMLLADAVPNRIAAALHAAGVAPTSLIVEITESSVMQDPEHALHTLRELTELGVCISLDDFGTGYSSLSYLRRLPVSELKIDRSFVQDLTGDTDTADPLVRSITGLGASLNLRTVAEGIETAEQYDAVRRLGCQVGQGYYIARPLPAEEFGQWLACRRTVAPPPLRAVATA